MKSKTQIEKHPMTKHQIENELAIRQDQQSKVPPTSEEWQWCSKRIHELAAMLTGKQNNDAWGRK